MSYPPQFSEDYIYPHIQHLDKLNVFMDSSGTDSMFLEISRLPEILSYGKHYGIISIKNPKGQPYYLRPNTKLQFEVKDSQGTVVFSDVASSEEILKTYGGSIIFYIWIKQDPLQTYKDIENGMGTLTIVGELTGVGLPPAWSGIPNYKCTFPIEINKNLPNTSPILFQSSSKIQTGLNFSESIDLDSNDINYKRSYIHISSSNMHTFGGKVEFVEAMYKEQGTRNTEYKTLATYPITSSVYEIESSSALGLNPISDIQPFPLPREVRRYSTLDFKLKFLNKNMEYAKDLRESSKFIEVSSSLAITGSPFILEQDDNIITGSNAGLFIASDGKGFAGTTVKLNMDPKTKEVKFDEYVNKVFTKPVFTMKPISKDGGSLVFNKDTNKVDISSGSNILGGKDNKIFSSKESAILGGSDNAITKSEGSSILAGTGNVIRDSGTGAGGDVAMTSNVIASTGATIKDSRYSTVVGGTDNTVDGTGANEDATTAQAALYHTIIGGANNAITTPLGSGQNLGDTIIGGSACQMDNQGNSFCVIAGGLVNIIGNNAQDGGNVIMGGLFNKIVSGSDQSFIAASWGGIVSKSAGGAVIGSVSSTVQNDNSVILGMSGKTTSADNTVYVQNLEVAGNMSVNSITSSIVTSSIIYTEGSNIFGDGPEDSHKFNGHITASGEISSSGNIIAPGIVTHEFYNKVGNNWLELNGSNIVTFNADNTNNDFRIHGDTNDSIFFLDAGNEKVGIGGTTKPAEELTVLGNISGSGTLNIGNYNTDGGHITASGDISASGDLYFDKIKHDVFIEHANSPKVVIKDTTNNFALELEHINSTAYVRFDDHANQDLIFDSNANGSHMVLDGGTGKTGIGTSTIPSTLTVNGDLKTSTHITASGNISASGHIYLGPTKNLYFNQVDDTYIDSDSTDRIRFVAGGQQMLVLDYDTGNRAAFGDTKVGIGSGAGDNFLPTADLHVGGNLWISGSNGHITASQNISSSITSTGSFGNIIVGHTIHRAADPNTRIYFSDDDINITVGGMNMVDFTEAGSDEITFNESAQDLDVRIEGEDDANLLFTDATSPGRVGIGTNTPQAKLHVEGDISASGNLHIEGDITSSGFIKANKFEALTWYNRTGDADTGLYMEDNLVNLKAGGKSLIKLDWGNSNDKILINNTNENIDLHVNADDGNVILATDATNNRVGINTTTPTKALEVTGDVSASGDLYINDISASGNFYADGNLVLGELNGGAYISASNGNIELSGSGDGLLIVDGDISASGAIYAQSFVSQSTGGDVIANTLRVGTDTTSGKEVTITGEISASGNLYLGGGIDVTNITASGDHYIQMGNGLSTTFVNRDGSANLMEIDEVTGNVGIGNSSPPEKLTVTGDISASGDFYIGDDIFMGPSGFPTHEIAVHGGGGFQIKSGSTEVINIPMSTVPRVGINTSGDQDLTSTLTVRGDISASGDLVLGDLHNGAYISASQGTIEVSGSGLGLTVGSWSDGYHGNDEFIAITAGDFNWSDQSNRGHATYTDTTGGSAKSLEGVDVFATKIIPKGFTATAGIIYGSSTSDNHIWYSSSLSVGTSADVGTGTTAVDTAKTFGTPIVGDGETYVICEVDKSAVSTQIYGGKITISRT